MSSNKHIHLIGPMLGLIVLCGPVSLAAQQDAAGRIQVSVNPNGPAVIKTPAAEFELSGSGYLRGYLLKGGHRLTLDEPDASEPKGGANLALDFQHARTANAHGAMGDGRRIEVPAAADGSSIEKVLALEVYDDFPSVAFLTVTYRNRGTGPVNLGKVSVQRHRLNASLAAPGAKPYDMWSFQGSSYKWGADDVTPITKKFSLENRVGPSSLNGLGGGIPLVAFWTRQAGLSIGHADPVVRILSLPVATQDDGRVDASIRIDTARTLAPNESWSTPRTFLAVFSGDYYEPVRLWSEILQRQNWILAEPTDNSYEANWCGWGYLGTVTPKQMLGTLPKLKMYGFKWATLDAGWFGPTGDWEPNPKTFPGDSLRKLIDEYHRNGIRITAWWLPLGAADGQGTGRRAGANSRVAQEHPEWIILDAQGKRGRLQDSGRVAALCPAVPEVQEYYRHIVEKLIRDYDFDGSKLDYSYSVPPCYNPAHHHKSPEDSVKAVADVYRIVYETSRKLKPYAVTQICPCGTTPNPAWLPFMDQAVTADPVGSVQVRRRIKLYKALLGPRSAVYGDHVELSKIIFKKDQEIDIGEDFASTVGTGGVLGTKFTWPDYGPRFADAFLTPRKEERWRKWIGLYNERMLSKGTFLNLYSIGYDTPEGYAIAKDGKMYYAFYAADPSQPWKGKLELRGLEPGRYRVLDYENQKTLGTVDASDPALTAAFTDHLLLEVSKE